MLNTHSLAMAVRLLNSCKAENGELQIETAKIKLRELWTLEKTFLQGALQYRQLLRERGISEGGYVSEAFYVDTDYLGHLTLCYLEHIPVWKEYIIKFHRDAIEELVSLGSWQAPKWLEDGAKSNHFPRKKLQTDSSTGMLRRWRPCKRAINSARTCDNAGLILANFPNGGLSY